MVTIYYATIIKMPSENGQTLSTEEALEKGKQAVAKVFGDGKYNPNVLGIRLPENTKPSPNILDYQNVESGEPAIMLRGAWGGYYPPSGEDKAIENEISNRMSQVARQLGQNQIYTFLSPERGFEGQMPADVKTDHVQLYNRYSLYTIDHPVPLDSMTAEHNFVAPITGKIYPATISYYSRILSHAMRPAITIAFRDGGETLNAKEIAQALWGPEAGGDAGVAWSPVGAFEWESSNSYEWDDTKVSYAHNETLEALDLVEKLEQLKDLEAQIEQCNPTGKDAIARFSELCAEAKELGTELHEKYPEISILDKYSHDVRNGIDQRYGKD